MQETYHFVLPKYNKLHEVQFQRQPHHLINFPRGFVSFFNSLYLPPFLPTPPNPHPFLSSPTPTPHLFKFLESKLEALCVVGHSVGHDLIDGIKQHGLVAVVGLDECVEAANNLGLVRELKEKVALKIRLFSC